MRLISLHNERHIFHMSLSGVRCNKHHERTARPSPSVREGECIQGTIAIFAVILPLTSAASGEFWTLMLEHRPC